MFMSTRKYKYFVEKKSISMLKMKSKNVAPKGFHIDMEFPLFRFSELSLLQKFKTNFVKCTLYSVQCKYYKNVFKLD